MGSNIGCLSATFKITSVERRAHRGKGDHTSMNVYYSVVCNHAGMSNSLIIFDVILFATNYRLNERTGTRQKRIVLIW